VWLWSIAGPSRRLLSGQHGRADHAGVGSALGQGELRAPQQGGQRPGLGLLGHLLGQAPHPFLGLPARLAGGRLDLLVQLGLDPLDLGLSRTRGVSRPALGDDHPPRGLVETRLQLLDPGLSARRELARLLAVGAAKARDESAPTLAAMYERMGFVSAGGSLRFPPASPPSDT